MKLSFLVLIMVATLMSLPAFAQGALEPAGPPGPTMKTLSQVEPRNPVPENGLITTPGSYYLTENVNGSIAVLADDVSLDLNGFTVSRDISTTVVNVVNRSRIRIFNGMIRDGSVGISANGASNIFIKDVNVSGAGIAGIVANDPSGYISIEDVQIHDVALSGIRILSGDDQDVRVRVVNTTVTNANTSIDNTRSAISIAHIGTGDLTVDVFNNQTFSNRTHGITVSQEGSGESHGVISDNQVAGNGGSGLIVIGDFTVVRNVAHANTANYNLASAPNAAPTSSVGSSPGAWDNISE